MELKLVPRCGRKTEDREDRGSPMYTGTFCYLRRRPITCTEASSASVKSSSSTSFEACTSCMMHHASVRVSSGTFHRPWNLYKLPPTPTEASVAVVEASMGVVEASTEVVEVVGGSTPVLRASTAFSALPLTSKSRVVSTFIGFDQIPSLQSTLLDSQG